MFPIRRTQTTYKKPDIQLKLRKLEEIHYKSKKVVNDIYNKQEKFLMSRTNTLSHTIFPNSINPKSTCQSLFWKENIKKNLKLLRGNTMSNPLDNKSRSTSLKKIRKVYKAEILPQIQLSQIKYYIFQYIVKTLENSC